MFTIYDWAVIDRETRTVLATGLPYSAAIAMADARNEECGNWHRHMCTHRPEVLALYAAK